MRRTATTCRCAGRATRSSPSTSSAEWHSGAPRIARGGAVATVVDDVLGYLLYVVRAPGVTRRLEVDYLKPVLTGVAYVVRGRLDRREGRRLWVSCTGTGPRRRRRVPATGLFLVVDVSHFAQATSGGGQSPVAPQRARREPARRLPP